MTSTLLLLLLALLFLAFDVASGNNTGSCPVENTYKLGTTRSFGSSSSSSHMLVGAGMRTKFFLNIYAVGLYVTNNKHKVIGENYSKLGGLVDLNTNSGNDEYPLGICLKFQRAVGSDKVVDALVEALSTGVSSGEKDYSTKVEKFKTTLLGKLGSGGAKTGDEIEFVFPKSNEEVGLRVISSGSDATKNTKFEFVKSKALRDRLLDVYLNKEKAIAPDLVKSIDSVYKHYKK